MTLLPKFALLSAPSSFSCGMKSPLRSFQVRVAVVTMAAVGLARPVIVVRLSACRYRPMLALTAVLPLPNRS